MMQFVFIKALRKLSLIICLSLLAVLLVRYVVPILPIGQKLIQKLPEESFLVPFSLLVLSVGTILYRTISGVNYKPTKMELEEIFGCFTISVIVAKYISLTYFKLGLILSNLVWIVMVVPLFLLFRQIIDFLTSDIRLEDFDNLIHRKKEVKVNFPSVSDNYIKTRINLPRSQAVVAKRRRVGISHMFTQLRALVSLFISTSVDFLQNQAIAAERGRFGVARGFAEHRASVSLVILRIIKSVSDFFLRKVFDSKYVQHYRILLIGMFFGVIAVYIVVGELQYKKREADTYAYTHPVITSFEPHIVTTWNKVIIRGSGFGTKVNDNYRVVYTNGDRLLVDYWSDNKIIIELNVVRDPLEIRVVRTSNYGGGVEERESNPITLNFYKIGESTSEQKKRYFEQLNNMSDEAKRLYGINVF